jgi:REP element-mobilizing transposase RayT
MLGAHTDTLLLTHVIWATSGRAPLLVPRVDDWLAEFLAEQCRVLGCELLAVGNSKDHVHAVLRQAPSIALAEMVAEVDDAETTDAEKAARLAAAYDYQQRVCELSNAHLKHHHGVVQLLVRGVAKVTCVAMLAALTANLLQHATALLA